MTRRAVIAVLLLACVTTLTIDILTCGNPLPGPSGDPRFDTVFVLSVEWTSQSPRILSGFADGYFWLLYRQPIPGQPTSYSHRSVLGLRIVQMVSRATNEAAVGDLTVTGIAALLVGNAKSVSQRLTFVHVPLWQIALLLAAYPVATLVRSGIRRSRRRRKGLCLNCGYDLTGNVTGVCSECGRSL